MCHFHENEMANASGFSRRGWAPLKLIDAEQSRAEMGSFPLIFQIHRRVVKYFQYPLSKNDDSIFPLVEGTELKSMFINVTNFSINAIL